MSWHLMAPRKRSTALLIVVCALFILSTIASAQNSCPKDEVFGGYSWLAPNGWGDLDYKVNNIPNAFDASNTYYLPKFHDLGLLIDGSGHFRGGTTPANLQNGSNDATDVGYALGGLQYKYHASTLSPFVRGFIGAANISPDCCHGTEWSLAAGGGGGLDLNLRPRFSIRLVQADYIYSSYSHFYPSTHPTAWNSVRLAAGVVFNFGNYCNLPLSCSITMTPSQAEVFAGEPVKLNSSGANFSVKHTVNYRWTSTGGKLSSAATEAAEIDTAGLAPGNYSVVATLTDPKLRNMNSATCSTAFTVKPTPVPPPPSASCAPKSSTVDVGHPATITLTVDNPANLPLTYAWTTTAGQLSGSGASATLTPSNNEAGHTITVTGTVTDDRSRSAQDSCEVNVPSLPPPCVKIVDWGECTFEKDPKRPWRVDNACKDILDQLAIRLQEMPGGTLAIVGYTSEQEGSSSPDVGARRSVNAKYYLTTDGATKIDATRIQARQGGNMGKATHFYFVPAGELCEGQVDLGSAIDESKVQGQSRQLPARKKKASTKATDSPAQ